MDSYFTVFLSAYSLPTIIIAVIITSISFILDKTLFKKLPDAIKTLFPFVLSIVFNLLYDFIFVSEKFNISEYNVSSGILSGSLSSAFYAFIKNLKDTKSDFCLDPLTLSLQSVLRFGVTNDTEKVATLISDLLKEKAKSKEIDNLEKEIADIIKKYSTLKSDEEIKNLSILVIQNAKSFLNL